MKIKRGKFDIIIDILCVLLLLGTSVFLIISWRNLPDKVPMHFDFAGNADRWGKKTELIVVPVAGWIMYLLIFVIGRFPQLWNTGVKITEENRDRVYLNLFHLISSLKFLISVLFSILTVTIVKGVGLPIYFLPLMFVAIIGTLIFWIVRIVKVK